MKKSVIRVLGHQLRINIPEALEHWLVGRWPTTAPRRGAHPIDIQMNVVPWSEHLLSIDIPVFDQIIQAQQFEGGFSLRLRSSLLQLSIHNELTMMTLQGINNDLRFLLILALTETFRLGGLIPFHASAIAKDGRCAILMAPSKTGKSTTLVTAALSGYIPIAEDMVWVDPKHLVVYGNDLEIRLWPDSFNRFKSIFPVAAQRASDGKYVLRLDALPGYPPGECTLHRFVVLRRDLSEPSSWERPPQLELVRAIWEASGKPLIPRTQNLAQHGIQTLINAVSFTGLKIGNTPLDFTPLFS